ncbi:hypothetical protein Tco_0259717 [Tanacetum coccineum]
MSTQQDIYADGFENHPPMLNKDNYVPWSSRLLRYAKSKPNGKLICNSIMNGPYVRRMIPKPGDPDREVPVAETFLEQTDDEFTKKEVKQMEADDQAIQIILMGLPEDIYAAVDSCETAQEIWLEVNELRAKRLARAHDPLALIANSNNPYNYPVFHQDQPSQITYTQQPQPNNNFIPQPSFNMNYMQQPMPNLEDIIDPTNAMNMASVLMAKAFKLNYSTPTNNNQIISSNPRNRQIAQLVQNVRNQVVQLAVQNLGVQNVGNHNRLIVVLGLLIRMQIKLGMTQLLIDHKEEAGIQLHAEEFDLMAAAGDLDDIEEVNANCILMAHLQQALTSGTQTDNAPVYDSDGSAELHEYENCYNNEIFDMFTQEEQYTELLEPIPEPHKVQQNDSNVISVVSSLKQDGGTIK